MYLRPTPTARGSLSPLQGIAACALILALLSGCADTEFEQVDAAVPDRSPVVDQFVFPETVKMPDGVVVPAALKMYAHSREELFVISPSDLQLTVVGKFKFDKSIPVNETSVNDIAMDPDNNLWAITKTFLYKVNVKTVKATKVAVVTGDSQPPPMVALTFEESGMLLGSNMDGGLYRIYTKDVGTNKMGKVVMLGQYGSGQGSSGDLVAIQGGKIYGVSQKGQGATNEDNKMLQVYLPGGSVSKDKLAVAGCSLGQAKVWGLAYWAGTIYGFTRGDKADGRMISIKLDQGDITKTCTVKVIKTFPYEFWGAAVSPRAPIG